MPIDTASQALLQNAISLHRNGELERAAAIYARVLQSAPTDANVLHLCGLVRHQLGAHAEGAAHIQRAVDLVPDQPVLGNNLGDALRMAGVCMISLATIWLRTRLMPPWLAGSTYLLALLLLLVINLSLWVTLIFPAWVFFISVLILIMNFRQTHAAVAR